MCSIVGCGVSSSSISVSVKSCKSSIFSSRLREGMYCARNAGKCIFIGSVCIEIDDVSPWVCVLVVIVLSSLADVCMCLVVVSIVVCVSVVFVCFLVSGFLFGGVWVPIALVVLLFLGVFCVSICGFVFVWVFIVVVLLSVCVCIELVDFVFPVLGLVCSWFCVH